MRRALLALALAVLATPAPAVLPDEMLDDPALEARAREISRELRCPVCQGETIDDSHAPIARDLRLLVRERLLAGDSDAEVIAFVTARFGEAVRLSPDRSGSNLILWIAGPVLLLAGAGVAAAAIRRRAAAAPEPALTEEERARLSALTQD